MNAVTPEGGSAVEKDEGKAALAQVHPKLTTHRQDSTLTPLTAQQANTSVAVVPNNDQLALAGVSPQDGVVHQLSARKEVEGSLAGPRVVQPADNIRRRAPEAIATRSEAERPSLRRAARGVPQDPQPRASQRSGHRANDGDSRNLGRVESSRDPNLAPRDRRRSETQLSPKHRDPYAHVTSVLHDYRHNRISALEAQFKGVRRSTTAGDSHIEEGRASHSSFSRANTAGISLTSVSFSEKFQVPPPSSSASSYPRQESSQPRVTAADDHRRRVPHATLNVPHLRYAEARPSGKNSRSHSAQRRELPSPVSTYTGAERLPLVATQIPDRLKYVPPSEEERKLHRTETLRALEEWRERQRAIGARDRDAEVTFHEERFADVGERKRASAGRRLRSRSPLMHTSRSTVSVSSSSAAGWEQRFEDQVPRATKQASRHNRSSRSTFARDSANPPSGRHGYTKKGANSDDRRSKANLSARKATISFVASDSNLGSSFANDFEQRSQPSGRTGVGHEKVSTSPRSPTSPRKGRKTRKSASRHRASSALQREEKNSSTMNTTAFRRMLVFDVSAPTVDAF